MDYAANVLGYIPPPAAQAPPRSPMTLPNANQDPSNIYVQKLQSMATGAFSPSDPSYQWRFQQGQQAVERSTAARGLLDSGNAAIELQTYGQGMASQEYGAQFNRLLQGMQGVESQYSSQQNRLLALAGVNQEQQRIDQYQQQLGQGQQRIGQTQQQLGMQQQQQTWQQNVTSAEDVGIGAGLNAYAPSDLTGFSGGGDSSYTGGMDTSSIYIGGQGGGTGWSSDVSTWGNG